MNFKGKVAIVTGSALGIGRGIAIALAEQGADIAGFDILTKENEELANEIKALGRNALAIKCDVSDKDQVRSSVNQVLKEFGRIDILVNNAGVFNFTYAFNSDYDETIELFDKCYAVNARGTYLCSLAVVPTMIKQGSGAIINVITNHVKRDKYRPGVLEQGYDASKWAQLSLTDTMAIELKPHGILVNAICPAATDTPMLRSYLNVADNYGCRSTLPSMMSIEDVGMAVINILNWGKDGSVGQAPLITSREDCENLKFYQGDGKTIAT
ncbi:MAG: SDR family oxidoreductase [Clostridiaceae bacterium]|nr:SDR family oxidoreductase [Clostridiaceae bacterium]